MIGLLSICGSGQRWGGFRKELLPIKNNVWLLDNCIQNLEDQGCEEFIIVTTVPNLSALATHTTSHLSIKKIQFVIRDSPYDMWKNIRYGLQFCGNKPVFFAMADTIPQFKQKGLILQQHDIAFGMFPTSDPSRFSVRTKQGFQKSKSLPIGDYKAWGVVSWQPIVTNYWLSHNFDHFDTAFNAAASHFLPYYYDLDNYYDMASFDDYLTFLHENSF